MILATLAFAAPLGADAWKLVLASSFAPEDDPGLRDRILARAGALTDLGRPALSGGRATFLGAAALSLLLAGPAVAQRDGCSKCWMVASGPGKMKPSWPVSDHRTTYGGPPSAPRAPSRLRPSPRRRCGP